MAVVDVRIYGDGKTVVLATDEGDEAIRRHVRTEGAFRSQTIGVHLEAMYERAAVILWDAINRSPENLTAGQYLAAHLDDDGLSFQTGSRVVLSSPLGIGDLDRLEQMLLLSFPEKAAA